MSYGNDEAQQSGVDFMRTANEAFMKLASPEQGALERRQGVCGREGCGFGAKHTRYHPDFPASSPYITAVGGTDFLTKTVIGDETAWPDGGGGFSRHVRHPNYQQEMVAWFKANSTAMGARAASSSTTRGAATPTSPPSAGKKAESASAA